MSVSTDQRITEEEADIIACKMMEVVRKHAEAGNKEARMIIAETIFEASKESKRIQERFNL